MLSWSGLWNLMDVVSTDYVGAEIYYQAWYSWGMGFLAACVAFAAQFPILRYLKTSAEEVCRWKPSKTTTKKTYFT